MTGITIKAGFDYSVLDPDTADEGRRLAEHIRGQHGNMVRTAIDIGNNLIVVKEELGHGHFGNWLKAEFDFTARTAERYMQAAEHFAGKSDIVSQLPAATVYKLAAPSTPPEIRERVVADLEAGKPVNPKTVVREIEEATMPTMEEIEAKLARKRISRRRPITEADERRIERKMEAERAERLKREEEAEKAVSELNSIIARMDPIDARRLVEIITDRQIATRFLYGNVLGDILAVSTDDQGGSHE